MEYRGTKTMFADVCWKFCGEKEKWFLKEYQKENQWHTNILVFHVCCACFTRRLILHFSCAVLSCCRLDFQVFSQELSCLFPTFPVISEWHYACRWFKHKLAVWRRMFSKTLLKSESMKCRKANIESRKCEMWKQTLIVESMTKQNTFLKKTI